jgi:chromosome segregation ATPase
MADKPKTYAQQAAELKTVVEQKDREIDVLKQQLALVPELQGELAVLRDKVNRYAASTQQSVVGDKIQLNDLEARAIAAEARSQELRQQLMASQGFVNALQSQLDIAGAERDKGLGKDQKIQLVSEELKAANLRVAGLQQQNRDFQIEATEQIARAEKQVNNYRTLSEQQGKMLGEIFDLVKNAPDTLSLLKRIIGMT